MIFAAISDLPTAVIVVGGTLLAIFLRCGPGECAAALRALTGGAVDTFDADKIRSELAVQLREIERDGLLRARQRPFSDDEFADAMAALFAQRTLAAPLAVHTAYRAKRQAAGDTAIRTLAQAAELAPVFGLAGTLIALAHLPANGIDRAGYMAAIGMAVQATLYGLMLAHLVLAPLARMVERREWRQEDARQVLVDWLTRELTPICARRPDPHAPVHHSNTIAPAGLPIAPASSEPHLRQIA